MRWLWVLLLIGCGYIPAPYYYINQPRALSGREIHIEVDPDFGEGDLVAIDLAVRKWNYVLNGNIKLIIGGGDDWVILKTTYQGGDMVSWTGPAEIYIIRGRVLNEDMTGLVMWEIGNLLGSSVEVPVWERYRCIGREEMRIVSEKQGIPMERLNYCVYE